MEKVRTSLRRCVCIVLCLLLFAAVLPVSAFAECAETKTVRAGWYEDAYNITGEHGERSGYGYEYEQAVAAYTGWSYEYVRNGWANLLEMMGNGEIDCIWSSYTMDGREDEYQWAGLYMKSSQVVAVNADSDIYTLSDLAGKTIAVRSTAKPEDILRSRDSRIPELRKVISVQKRALNNDFH